MTTSTSQTLVSIAEASRITGIPQRTLYRIVARGKVKSIQYFGLAKPSGELVSRRLVILDENKLVAQPAK